MKIITELVPRPMKEPLRISGYTFSNFDTVLVRVSDSGASGIGEAQGVYYHNETPASMTAQIEAVRPALELGISRADLLQALPAGGARNAIDCALWDLEAKMTGVPVWRRAGLTEPQPLPTTITIDGVDPAMVAGRGRRHADFGSLKLKLLGDQDDARRIQALRAARPDAWIMVDGNGGLTLDRVEDLVPIMKECRVAVIEQPFPRGQEDLLEALSGRVRVAADESVQDVADLAQLRGRVDFVNIKLDKCGGLTEALFLAEAAATMGFSLMVGNMSGSSLAMAPAALVGQRCEIADLDGPLFLERDVSPSAAYDNGRISCPPELWGYPISA